jgi:uncharacterized OsmC-like protein
MPNYKVTAKLISDVRSVVDNSRTHSVVCDLPATQGGGDSGPMAVELALMSLADCAVTIFANVCKQSKIEISRLEAVVEAEKPADSPILTSVTVKVRTSAKARKELLDGAWRRTEANCPVLSIFEKPIPVKVEFEATSE